MSGRTSRTSVRSGEDTRWSLVFDTADKVFYANFERSLKHFRPNMPEEAWWPLVEMLLRSFVCDRN